MSAAPIKLSNGFQDEAIGKGYSNKKEMVAKTEPQQPNNAVSGGSSLSTAQQSGKSTIEPNGEPSISSHKDTKTSEYKQETSEKSHESEDKNAPSLQKQVEAAATETNTTPTPAQAEAGNYKKGHVVTSTSALKTQQAANVRALMQTGRTCTPVFVSLA